MLFSEHDFFVFDKVNKMISYLDFLLHVTSLTNTAHTFLKKDS